MPIGREGDDPGTGESNGDESDGYDVVIVGGGPSGSSAGVFTARAGMHTCILNRGPSSLARCAYLENYLGFPGGIDVPTFTRLCRDHAETAGCRYVADMAISIRREDTDGDREGSAGTTESHGDGNEADRNRKKGAFAVETADGRTIETPRVVAATKDDTDYLDALGEGEMFADGSYDGESYRYFDADYVDENGRTPIAGLYVAGPLGGCLDQAVASAGHGATVGFSVIADWLVSRGYPRGLARGYWDWLSKAETRDENWDERTREFVEASVPEDLSDERIEFLTAELQAHTDALFVEREAVRRRTRRGHRRLLEHIDDDVIRAYLTDRERRE